MNANRGLFVDFCAAITGYASFDLRERDLSLPIKICLKT